jgi:hypothetical protein
MLSVEHVYIRGVINGNECNIEVWWRWSSQLNEMEKVVGILAYFKTVFQQRNHDKASRIRST